MSSWVSDRMLGFSLQGGRCGTCILQGCTADDINPAHFYLIRTLNYGNYGIFLLVGHAGFISSTVVLVPGLTGEA